MLLAGSKPSTPQAQQRGAADKDKGAKEEQPTAASEQPEETSQAPEPVDPPLKVQLGARLKGLLQVRPAIYP